MKYGKRKGRGMINVACLESVSKFSMSLRKKKMENKRVRGMFLLNRGLKKSQDVSRFWSLLRNKSRKNNKKMFCKKKKRKKNNNNRIKSKIKKMKRTTMMIVIKMMMKMLNLHLHLHHPLLQFRNKTACLLE